MKNRHQSNENKMLGEGVLFGVVLELTQYTSAVNFDIDETKTIHDSLTSFELFYHVFCRYRTVKKVKIKHN